MLEEKVEPGTKPLDEVRDQIVQSMMPAATHEYYDEKLAALKESYGVRVNEEIEGSLSLVFFGRKDGRRSAEFRLLDSLSDVARNTPYRPRSGMVPPLVTASRWAPAGPRAKRGRRHPIRPSRREAEGRRSTHG